MQSWERIFHRLALPVESGGRGWLPSEIKKLTLHELDFYGGEESDLGGTKKMSLEEARLYRAKKKGQVDGQ